jgi:hypothetical protein
VGQLGGGRVDSLKALAQAVPAPTVGVITGLPADGSTLVASPTAIGITLPRVLNPASANDANNFKLIGAGSDAAFNTADDVTVPLTRTSGVYRIAANTINFSISQTLAPGLYRFTIASGAAGLRDPFNQQLDGNNNGTGGDARVVNFTIASRGAAQLITPAIGGTSANVNFGTRNSVDLVPPRVLGTSFEYTVRQRVTVTFDELITPATASAITLRNLTTNTLVPSTQYTLAFPTGEKKATLTINAGNVLANADYRITVGAASVRDVDGNAMSSDATGDFYFVNGDANHDRIVDFSDLLLLAQNYGLAGDFGRGDNNYDGVIGFADLLILAQNYGATLPPR